MKKYNIQSIIDWLYRISTLKWFNYLQDALIAAFPIIVVNGFLETILQALMTDNGFFVVIFHLEHFVASNAVLINQLTVLVQLLQVFANTIIAVQFSRNVIKSLDNNIACGAMAAFSFIILSIKLGQNHELIFLIHGVTFALLTGLGVSKCFDFFRVEVNKDDNDYQNALIATLTNIKPILCIIFCVLILKILNFEIDSNGINAHLHSIIQTALTDNHYSLIPVLLILFLRSISKFKSCFEICTSCCCCSSNCLLDVIFLFCPFGWRWHVTRIDNCRAHHRKKSTFEKVIDLVVHTDVF
ncbi:hypothetical protein [Lactiplantibacillus plantarum]|uniref:hypothetical protein n=1 Tax=Lactiplantibacillus plantarum TaxID=1590 RepID=UPI0007BB244F|nr:hypothetical protein [Lactiplantibacillus plantarum]KZU51810.1 PTS system cellobiose-specific IIC component [Lactiplantibacillus plantarum]